MTAATNKRIFEHNLVTATLPDKANKAARTTYSQHSPLARPTAAILLRGQPSAEPLPVFTQHRSDSRIPVEVTMSPVRNHAGQVISGIEVFRDLTEAVQCSKFGLSTALASTRITASFSLLPLRPP